MFSKKPTDETSGLEKTIDQLTQAMFHVPCDSDEYARMADQLQKLYPLKETDSKRKVSPDTLALIAGNLAGIVAIVGYERVHVVTSKAMSFILKLR